MGILFQWILFLGYCVGLSLALQTSLEEWLAGLGL